MQKLHVLWSLTLAIALALLMLGLVSVYPVLNSQAATQDEITEFQFYRNTAVAADGCSQPVNARINGNLELQLDVVMPTVNTATFTVYHSNDGVTYSAGWEAATELVTDTHVLTYQADNNHGVFTKLCANVSTTDTLTVTSRGLFKP